MNLKSARFEDRLKKLNRLLSILRLLDNRERITATSLAEKFNISKRNIFRDIRDLEHAGFSVIFDDGIRSYSFANSDFTLRDLDLSDNEIMALLIGNQMAHSLGKPFEDAFRSILKKAHKETGAKTRGKFKRIEDKSWFWVDMESASDFESIEKQYKAVLDAMEKRVELDIVYKGMHAQRETRRCIAPYGLFFSRGVWYALAHCNLRNDIRIFALDCIKEFRLTNRDYDLPTDFNIGEYLKPGWRIMRYGEAVEVVLRFSSEVARWIKRRNWHPTQVIENQRDGSILFKVKLRGTEEIRKWSYNWAPHCDIIAPPELREKAAEEVAELNRLYNKSKRTDKVVK